MRDQIETIGRSMVQHGPDSDRIYLMHLHPEDMPTIVSTLDALARKKGYGKVFAKVPSPHHIRFVAAGYVTEAIIPGFFGAATDGHFMCRYLNQRRSQADNLDHIRAILGHAQQKAAEVSVEPRGETGGYEHRECGPEDIPSLASLYKQAFPSYPFPIQDPRFLAQCMAEHVTYAGAWHQGKLVAAASAEKYPDDSHVEMTDFATHQSHRRQGLAISLLWRLERIVRSQGLRTAYTIARATSAGMNGTFARCGYTYSGTLINNTQISGQVESMNVWYKKLHPAAPFVAGMAPFEISSGVTVGGPDGQ